MVNFVSLCMEYKLWYLGVIGTALAHNLGLLVHNLVLLVYSIGIHHVTLPHLFTQSQLLYMIHSIDRDVHNVLIKNSVLLHSYANHSLC